MVLNAWREHFCGTVKPHSKSWPRSILPTMRTGLGTEAVPLLIISPAGYLGAANQTSTISEARAEKRPKKAFLPQEGATVFVINTKIQRFFTSLLQLCLKGCEAKIFLKGEVARKFSCSSEGATGRDRCPDTASAQCHH